MVDDPRGTCPTGPGWAAESADPEQLDRFRAFLEDEALPAGGIGPSERDRLTGRHIHDSLGFSVAWHAEPPPARVVDIGSGVGLPGIPLAILWPATTVTLVERSGRRARLLRRVARILGLSSVEVVERDVAALGPVTGAGIVMRAVFPPAEAPDRLEHLDWERLVVGSGPDDAAAWGERRSYQVFARQGWVRTMRRA